MRRLVLLVLIAAVLVTDLRPLDAITPASTLPAHHVRGGGFRNVSPHYAYPLLGRAVRAVQRALRPGLQPGPGLAVLPNDGAALRANGLAPTVTWVGHSTFLVQLDGVNILTDPHWGERASPVDFAGPRRLAAPGIRFEDLPPIDAVIISHDHYDHLDEETVRRLASDHRPTFFVPLGIGQWLAERGIDQVVELDWWRTARFRGLVMACTPAQHSSGRGLHDQNLRLWASWVVLGARRRFFFAGDTGYYDGFKEIGARFGPFDLAAIPIGGYSAWNPHPNHVNPEEAVRVFEDVQGRLMVPMHWGTFELNRERADEPPGRLQRAARARGLTPRVAVLAPGQTIHW